MTEYERVKAMVRVVTAAGYDAVHLDTLDGFAVADMRGDEPSDVALVITHSALDMARRRERVALLRELAQEMRRGDVGFCCEKTGLRCIDVEDIEERADALEAGK